MSGVSDAAETQPKHVQHLDRAKARADIQFLGFCLDERKKSSRDVTRETLKDTITPEELTMMWVAGGKRKIVS
jgi:hypothetical protein